ncbi:MAG: DUF6807 family protein [Planctomycetota bacterium]|jgi:hypothetical protein
MKGLVQSIFIDCWFRWAVALAFVGLWSAGCSTFQIATDDAGVFFYVGGGGDGDEPLVKYRYADVPFKSYVEEFRTPAGINVLRDSPHDHKHHHALMLGITVDGINFWAEFPECGKQTHREFTDWIKDTHQGLQRAAVTDLVDWTDVTGEKTVIHEHRTIEAYQGNDLGASLLTWDTRFELPGGKQFATITGGYYYGLGMRFVQSMDVGGDFLFADGKAGIKEQTITRSTWCAYQAKVEGKEVTVAVFDHPRNLRHPATFFTMATHFSYISATLNLKAKPVRVLAAKPLQLRYGVALWDGHVDAATIEKLYQKWVGL